MAEQQTKKKKGPPQEILTNKQVFPLIGLGTYKIQDQLTLTNLLRKGLQLGFCKHIDTARMYNNQIPLGKAIKTVINEGRVKRQQLFIASKIFGLKGESVQRQIKQALQLMQLKYLDLVYLHWPFVDMGNQLSQLQFNHKSLEEVWAQMELCVTKGYIKHLGISNANGQTISQLLTFCKIKPIALQVQVHPYFPNNALVQHAQKNGIIVIAYVPLARGDSVTNEDNNIIKQQAIMDIAAKHGKTPAQVVLKSTLQRGIGIIPKTSNPNRLQQNFESWNFELGEDDWKKIRPLSKGYRICDGNTLYKVACMFD